MNEKVYIIFDNIVRFRFNSQNCKAFLLKEAFTFNLIEIGLKLPHIFFSHVFTLTHYGNRFALPYLFFTYFLWDLWPKSHQH